MRNTSLAAADSIAEVASQLRARVLYEIRNTGGSTCDEIEESLDLSHQTASPRVHELMEAGRIEDSGARRPTRSGAKAIVWTVALPKEVTVEPVTERKLTARQEVVIGDCIETMKQMQDNCVDAVVTDPPYELGFMGKKWDATGIAYNVAMWREVLRVLKPGGHLLAFGGTRTYHRMTCAIEDAGFEIRDSLHWMYGTGFPKSLDVSKAIEAGGGPESIRRLSMKGKYKPSGRGRIDYDHGGASVMNGSTDAVDLGPAAAAWAGWGTALKPGHEPIVLARKPLIGTVAANVQAFGTGALNIDASRIESDGDHNVFGKQTGFQPTNADGRWPANVLLDEDAAAELDGQAGERTSGANPTRRGADGARSAFGTFAGQEECTAPRGAEKGGASRFFYVAKPSRKERDLGCEHLPARTAGEATDREDGSDGLSSPRAGAGRTGGAKNYHPTVKPIELMRYLVRFITPPGGVVLDPFAGSGTTGCGATLEDFNFIGIERDSEYAEIAKTRIKHWRGGQEQADEIVNAAATEDAIVNIVENEDAVVNENERSERVENKITSTTTRNNDNEQGEETMAFFPPGFGYETAKKEATVSRQRLNDGDYVFMHKACFVKTTKAGDAIIVEHEIMEAKKIKDGIEPTPAGTTWGYFLPLYGDAAVMAQPNMKAYALNLYGIDEKKADLTKLGEMIDAIGSPEQVARGMLIRGITFHTNKKDGDDFMGVNWSAIPGENVAGSPNVLARRAKLDSLAGAAAPAATAPAGVPAAPPALGIPAAPPAGNPLQAAIAAGWQKHPASPAHWYLGQVVKTEADLIAGR